MLLLLRGCPTDTQHMSLNKGSRTSYSILYIQEFSSEIRKRQLRNSIPRIRNAMQLSCLLLQDHLSHCRSGDPPLDEHKYCNKRERLGWGPRMNGNTLLKYNI